jgi:isorenieratene synthase
MERAATSGMLAANELLRRFGIAGEEIWSIPPKGVLSFLAKR